MQAFQRNMEGVRSVLGEPEEVTVATVPGCDNLVDWMNVFRITQARPATQSTLHQFVELTGDGACSDISLDRFFKRLQPKLELSSPSVIVRPCDAHPGPIMYSKGSRGRWGLPLVLKLSVR